MIEGPEEMGKLLPRIMDDYAANRNLFANKTLPEYVALNMLDLSERDRALFLTLTCVTNHIHDGTGRSKRTDGEDGLWQTCADLWKTSRWIFSPDDLVGDNRLDELKELFASLEIMDHRDPVWWYRNAETLYEQWDGDVRSLLAEPMISDLSPNDLAYDAPTIERTIKENNFPALGGDKIRPLWLRLMHEEVHELKQIETINIPVDYHIVELTNRLKGTGADFDSSEKDDRETVRRYWMVICQKNG
jgi:hypothetical protein